MGTAAVPTPVAPSGDLLLILPELVLTGLGLLLLLVEMAAPRRAALCGWLAALGFAAAAAAVAVPWRALQEQEGAGQLIPLFAPPGAALTAFSGSMVVDGFALVMKVIILLGSMLSVLIAIRYAERFRNPGEFYAILAFAASAGAFLTGACDLLMIYLSVEFLSIGSYVLAGYLKFQPRSAEAALKYFLYGAITAAVMLYGMSFLYGVAGTLNLYPDPGTGRESLVAGMQAASQKTGAAAVLLVAMVMVTVGLGFKIGMAPFHQWVPDVYDGSPLPVMAWLSVASKAAGMAVFLRVFMVVFPGELWVLPVAALSALTMTVGNLAALPQTNIKRMLAYSSVAHAGYTLMAVAALGATRVGRGPDGVPSVWQSYGVLAYLAIYVFMNLGALAVVTAVYNQIKSHRIEDYAGLSERAPALAWLMVFFLLSLAGIPPTAGFWGKFVLFAGVLESREIYPHLLWLAIAGFLNTVISVYYYWNVVRAMFLLKATSSEGVPQAPELRLTLAVTAGATLAIFLFAGQFMALFASG